MSDTKVIFLQP